MKCVFKPSENFSIVADGDLLKQHCRIVGEKFIGLQVEYFYYIKACEPDAFFIIRIEKAAVEPFVAAMRDFAENLSFAILNKKESNDFFFRTEALEDYV